ncbi:MAG: OPT family oligopeptide transporter, partial [Planctomycetota bacterium]
MKLDKELQEFHDLMKPPGRFDDGFSWVSLIGAIFIGLLMVPGSMYMNLVAGLDVGGAARWVTVILFLEVARRTHKHLKRAEIFVLFYMAAAAAAVPFRGLLYRQFFVQSDAVLAQGWQGQIPWWYAPSDPDVLAQRSFFMWEWLAPIGMIVLFKILSRLDSRILGFGLFKVTSDLEKLPFPMAPVGAQGILALAEEEDETSWRWRAFSIGGAIGLIFGAVYIGVPILSNAILGVTIQPLPIPFVDWTGNTQEILPAVATGISFDATHLFIGMVMPWYAMLGSFVGLVVTLVANPVLYHAGILNQWQRGDGTVTTLFKNTVDFYFSFGIGLSLSIALIGFYSVWRSVRRAKAEGQAREEAFGPPPGRGDIPNWAIIGVYVVSCAIYIGISGALIGWHSGVMAVLLVYALLYTPIISYVTARLEGICGQVLNIPLAREVGFILSGYHGLKVWFLPIPLSNYGADTVLYRQAELTGTRFWSIWKADLFLVPFILICSILFANFIWSMAPIPSAAYPYT